MKQFSLLALMVTAGVVLSSSVFAESGSIHFKGALTAASCTTTVGGDATGGGALPIELDLGTVTGDSLKPWNTAGLVAPSAINLSINCQDADGLKAVVMKFDPASGSGLDGGVPQLLKMTGVAKGASVALVNSKGAVVDLTQEVSAPMTVDGTTNVGVAQLDLRAMMVADSAASTVVPGEGEANLPFTLNYE